MIFKKKLKKLFKKIKNLILINIKKKLQVSVYQFQMQFKETINIMIKEVEKNYVFI